MYVHVYRGECICAYVHVCMCPYKCMCRGQRLVTAMFFDQFPPYLLRQGFSVTKTY